MGIRRLTYKDIPSSLRAKAAGEASRRLQAVLSDPVATAEQRDVARRQQGILRHWASGTLASELGEPEPGEPAEEQTPAETAEGASDLLVEEPEET